MESEKLHLLSDNDSVPPHRQSWSGEVRRAPYLPGTTSNNVTWRRPPDHTRTSSPNFRSTSLRLIQEDVLQSPRQPPPQPQQLLLDPTLAPGRQSAAQSPQRLVPTMVRFSGAAMRSSFPESANLHSLGASDGRRVPAFGPTYLTHSVPQPPSASTMFTEGTAADSGGGGGNSGPLKERVHVSPELLVSPATGAGPPGRDPALPTQHQPRHAADAADSPRGHLISGPQPPGAPRPQPSTGTADAAVAHQQQQHYAASRPRPPAGVSRPQSGATTPPRSGDKAKAPPEASPSPATPSARAMPDAAAGAAVAPEQPSGSGSPRSRSSSSSAAAAAAEPKSPRPQRHTPAGCKLVPSSPVPLAEKPSATAAVVTRGSATTPTAAATAAPRRQQAAAREVLARSASPRRAPDKAPSEFPFSPAEVLMLAADPAAGGGRAAQLRRTADGVEGGRVHLLITTAREEEQSDQEEEFHAAQYQGAERRPQQGRDSAGPGKGGPASPAGGMNALLSSGRPGSAAGRGRARPAPIPRPAPAQVAGAARSDSGSAPGGQVESAVATASEIERAAVPQVQQQKQQQPVPPPEPGAAFSCTVNTPAAAAGTDAAGPTKDSNNNSKVAGSVGDPGITATTVEPCVPVAPAPEAPLLHVLPAAAPAPHHQPTPHHHRHSSASQVPSSGEEGSATSALYQKADCSFAAATGAFSGFTPPPPTQSSPPSSSPQATRPPGPDASSPSPVVASSPAHEPPVAITPPPPYSAADPGDPLAFGAEFSMPSFGQGLGTGLLLLSSSSPAASSAPGSRGSSLTPSSQGSSHQGSTPPSLATDSEGPASGGSSGRGSLLGDGEHEVASSGAGPAGTGGGTGAGAGPKPGCGAVAVSETGATVRQLAALVVAGRAGAGVSGVGAEGVLATSDPRVGASLGGADTVASTAGRDLSPGHYSRESHSRGRQLPATQPHWGRVSVVEGSTSSAGGGGGGGGPQRPTAASSASHAAAAAGGDGYRCVGAHRLVERLEQLWRLVEGGAPAEAVSEHLASAGPWSGRDLLSRREADGRTLLHVAASADGSRPTPRQHHYHRGRATPPPPPPWDPQHTSPLRRQLTEFGRARSSLRTRSRSASPPPPRQAPGLQLHQETQQQPQQPHQEDEDDEKGVGSCGKVARLERAAAVCDVLLGAAAAAAAAAAGVPGGESAAGVEEEMLTAREEETGYTPLHLAVLASNQPLLEALLAHCEGRRHALDIRCKARGHTPLHLALRRGDAAAALRLLRAGADPRVTDDAGRCPAAAAIREATSGRYHQTATATATATATEGPNQPARRRASELGQLSWYGPGPVAAAEEAEGRGVPPRAAGTAVLERVIRGLLPALHTWVDNGDASDGNDEEDGGGGLEGPGRRSHAGSSNPCGGSAAEDEEAAMANVRAGVARMLQVLHAAHPRAADGLLEILFRRMRDRHGPDRCPCCCCSGTSSTPGGPSDPDGIGIGSGSGGSIFAGSHGSGRDQAAARIVWPCRPRSPQCRAAADAWGLLLAAACQVAGPLEQAAAGSEGRGGGGGGLFVRHVADLLLSCFPRAAAHFGGSVAAAGCLPAVCSEAVAEVVCGVTGMRDSGIQLAFVRSLRLSGLHAAIHRALGLTAPPPLPGRQACLPGPACRPHIRDAAHSVAVEGSAAKPIEGGPKARAACQGGRPAGDVELGIETTGASPSPTHDVSGKRSGGIASDRGGGGAACNSGRVRGCCCGGCRWAPGGEAARPAAVPWHPEARRVAELLYCGIASGLERAAAAAAAASTAEGDPWTPPPPLQLTLMLLHQSEAATSPGSCLGEGGASTTAACGLLEDLVACQPAFTRILRTLETRGSAHHRPPPVPDYHDHDDRGNSRCCGAGGTCQVGASQPPGTGSVPGPPGVLTGDAVDLDLHCLDVGRLLRAALAVQSPEAVLQVATAASHWALGANQQCSAGCPSAPGAHPRFLSGLDPQLLSALVLRGHTLAALTLLSLPSTAAAVSSKPISAHSPAWPCSTLSLLDDPAAGAGRQGAHLVVAPASCGSDLGGSRGPCRRLAWRPSGFRQAELVWALAASSREKDEEKGSHSALGRGCGPAEADTVVEAAVEAALGLLGCTAWPPEVLAMVGEHLGALEGQCAAPGLTAGRGIGRGPTPGSSGSSPPASAGRRQRLGGRSEEAADSAAAAAAARGGAHGVGGGSRDEQEDTEQMLDLDPGLGEPSAASVYSSSAADATTTPQSGNSGQEATAAAPTNDRASLASLQSPPFSVACLTGSKLPPLRACQSTLSQDVTRRRPATVTGAEDDGGSGQGGGTGPIPDFGSGAGATDGVSAAVFPPTPPVAGASGPQPLAAAGPGPVAEAQFLLHLPPLQEESTECGASGDRSGDPAGRDCYGRTLGMGVVAGAAAAAASATSPPAQLPPAANRDVVVLTRMAAGATAAGVSPRAATATATAAAVVATLACGGKGDGDDDGDGDAATTDFSAGAVRGCAGDAGKSASGHAAGSSPRPGLPPRGGGTVLHLGKRHRLPLTSRGSVAPAPPAAAGAGAVGHTGPAGSGAKTMDCRATAARATMFSTASTHHTPPSTVLDWLVARGLPAAVVVEAVCSAAAAATAAAAAAAAEAAAAGGAAAGPHGAAAGKTSLPTEPAILTGKERKPRGTADGQAIAAAATDAVHSLLASLVLLLRAPYGLSGRHVGALLRTPSVSPPSSSSAVASACSVVPPPLPGGTPGRGLPRLLGYCRSGAVRPEDLRELVVLHGMDVLGVLDAMAGVAGSLRGRLPRSFLEAHPDLDTALRRLESPPPQTPGGQDPPVQDPGEGEGGGRQGAGAIVVRELLRAWRKERWRPDFWDALLRPADPLLHRLRALLSQQQQQQQQQQQPRQCCPTWLLRQQQQQQQQPPLLPLPAPWTPHSRCFPHDPGAALLDPLPSRCPQTVGAAACGHPTDYRTTVAAALGTPPGTPTVVMAAYVGPWWLLHRWLAVGAAWLLWQGWRLTSGLTRTRTRTRTTARGMGDHDAEQAAGVWMCASATSGYGLTAAQCDASDGGNTVPGYCEALVARVHPLLGAASVTLQPPAASPPSHSSSSSTAASTSTGQGVQQAGPRAEGASWQLPSLLHAVVAAGAPLPYMGTCLVQEVTAVHWDLYAKALAWLRLLQRLGSLLACMALVSLMVLLARDDGTGGTDPRVNATPTAQHPAGSRTGVPAVMVAEYMLAGLLLTLSVGAVADGLRAALRQSKELRVKRSRQAGFWGGLLAGGLLPAALAATCLVTAGPAGGSGASSRAVAGLAAVAVPALAAHVAAAVPVLSWDASLLADRLALVAGKIRPYLLLLCWLVATFLLPLAALLQLLRSAPTAAGSAVGRVAAGLAGYGVSGGLHWPEMHDSVVVGSGWAAGLAAALLVVFALLASALLLLLLATTIAVVVRGMPRDAVAARLTARRATFIVQALDCMTPGSLERLVSATGLQQPYLHSLCAACVPVAAATAAESDEGNTLTGPAPGLAGRMDTQRQQHMGWQGRVLSPPETFSAGLTAPAGREDSGGMRSEPTQRSPSRSSLTRGVLDGAGVKERVTAACGDVAGPGARAGRHCPSPTPAAAASSPRVRFADSSSWSAGTVAQATRQRGSSRHSGGGGAGGATVDPGAGAGAGAGAPGGLQENDMRGWRGRAGRSPSPAGRAPPAGDQGGGSSLLLATAAPGSLHPRRSPSPALRPSLARHLHLAAAVSPDGLSTGAPGLGAQGSGSRPQRGYASPP